VSRRIVGLGAGGHAKVVIEVLRAAGDWEVAGLLDSDAGLWKHEVVGVLVLGGDDLLDGLVAGGLRFAFIGVGMVGDPSARRRLFESVLASGLEVATAVHPAATLSPSAVIGSGATIMAGAIINAEARLGEDVIVNTGAVVEHDCRIGNHVHLAPGAIIGGGVEIGEGTHVGLGARVIQGIRIGSGALVAAGAVVVRDLPDAARVAGVPARQMRADAGR
jgi:sugar O-acyltransferase (sialic acid O-acetyltransferase NeuD family)